MYGVIDVGTTGVKLSIYDKNLNKIYHEKTAIGFEKVGQDRIEQDSLRLAYIVKRFTSKAKEHGVKKIGLCTYRASVIAWRKDGAPITNVITWMDGRGRRVVDELSPTTRLLKRFHRALKIILSPDSPAVLLRWIYDNVPGLIEDVNSGKAFAWTLDSYLIYILTGRFQADPTNATLTGLIHPKNLSQIDIVFELLKLPKITPEIKNNVDFFGNLDDLDLNVCIADQQAASVGLGVLERGRVQSIHGTGSFIETATESLIMPRGGLIPLIILSIDGEKTYGLEGFMRSTGSTLEWLMKMGLFKDYREAENLLEQSERRILIIPSFTGIRTPYLVDLKGIMLGLGLDTSKADIVSGLALGVSLHTAFIIKTVKKYVQEFKKPLFSGGGYSKSDGFLQMLADITGMEVARPVDVEASSLGVAKLLALSDGLLSKKDLREEPAIGKLFTPKLENIEREKLLREYSKLLEGIRKWEKNLLLRGIS